MHKPARLQAPSLPDIQLAWLQEIGIDKHMLARFAHGPASSPAHADVALAAVADQAEGPVVNLPQEWTALQDHAAQCQQCDLHAGRSAVVFGAGVEHQPEWLIVGEAPGPSDDRNGLPFQGKPGLLLQAMLASIGLGLPSVFQPGVATAGDGSLQRSIYCANVIKCRPLGNRTPTPQEILACMPYLQRQIQILRPRRILALGNLAAQALLGVDSPLEELRGRIHQLACGPGGTIPLVATWHPASLLLKPQQKADVWADLALAQSLMTKAL